MIRSELIARIAAKNSHLHSKDVEKVVRAILDRITAALVFGDRVEIRGMGMFSVRTHDARSCRNPKTGEAVAVAEKKVIAFKPAKAMRFDSNAFGLPAALNPSNVAHGIGIRDG